MTFRYIVLIRENADHVHPSYGYKSIFLEIDHTRDEARSATFADVVAFLWTVIICAAIVAAVRL